MFKANWNATLDIKSRKMRIFIVIRDCIGKMISTCSSKKDHVSSPKIAESYALKRAMLLCAELGLLSIAFEGDAIVLIEGVNAREERCVPYGQIIAEVKLLYNSHTSRTASYIPREGNKAAHLAKHAKSKLEEEFWLKISHLVVLIVFYKKKYVWTISLIEMKEVIIKKKIIKY